MSDHVVLKLPKDPAKAKPFIDAIYRAWDSYGKPGNVGHMGSPEATRIYREFLAMGETTQA